MRFCRYLIATLIATLTLVGLQPVRSTASSQWAAMNFAWEKPRKQLPSVIRFQEHTGAGAVTIVMVTEGAHRKAMISVFVFGCLFACLFVFVLIA